MKEVGAYDVRTHFAELLDEVENGEVILVTRRGKPVAKIVPYHTEQMSLDDIMGEFERLRKQISTEGPSIREMIEEGRRY
ncbi:MAG: type II toxin-antitoxin system prevent-host-death family antitoxin [Alicyclobacillus sp.]|nr:type II toxin-antitoxin system prevent-host-death family antitoxin [Alicyclobacillus sp.]